MLVPLRAPTKAACGIKCAWSAMSRIRRIGGWVLVLPRQAMAVEPIASVVSRARDSRV